MIREREDVSLSEEEQEKLKILQEGIKFKYNKDEYKDTTWDSLNEVLGSPYANGESFRCAVKAFQRSFRGIEGEEHKNALPYASDDEEKLLEIKKERVKLQDERRQYAEYYRNIARKETFEEIAKDVATKISKSKPMLKPTTKLVGGENCGISMISDWHFGLDFDNIINTYNSDIAVERVNKLLSKSIECYKLHKVSKVYVVNLQDLISGWIKPTIRLENRENLIEQIMKTSELVAEFLQKLSEYFEVEYYSTLDNHSRLDPNKKEALKLENFAIIMNWYLKTRLMNNDRIKINSNELSEDIATFNVLGYNVVAVHGDLDKPTDVVSNLTLLTKRFYEIALMGHRHHFYASEDSETIVVSNGTLAGVDGFAEKLRLTSRPSQNIVIVSKEGLECIYPINLK